MLAFQICSSPPNKVESAPCLQSDVFTLENSILDGLHSSMLGKLGAGDSHMTDMCRSCDIMGGDLQYSRCPPASLWGPGDRDKDGNVSATISQ